MGHSIGGRDSERWGTVGNGIAGTGTVNERGDGSNTTRRGTVGVRGTTVALTQLGGNSNLCDLYTDLL